MKFTIISHACMYIEYLDVRLIVDPWFVGSCYWRSWWNYPEPSNDLIRSLNPTHVYITHLHWDHFHGPSLRSFYKSDPVILLPKSPTSRMINDIKSDFRFSSVRELDHGREYSLGEDFCITSYQFNPVFIDSALALRAGGVSLLNANDAKTFGWSLGNIKRRYQEFDFVFRSHSSAGPHPYCFPDEDLSTSARLPSDYSDDFISFSEALNTKYVVPFASSHVYLHKDTFKYNRYYNSPLMLKQKYDQCSPRAELVLMPSGSSWSSQDGFSINAHNYENIFSDIERMARVHGKSLEIEYQKNINSTLREAKIVDYFRRFSCSTGFPFPRLRFGFFVVSSLDETEGALVIVDTKTSACTFEKGVVFSRSLMVTGELDFIIKVSRAVLNDCVSKSMFNTFSASKLLLVYECKPGKASRLFTMLDLFENDMLPIWNVFTARQFMVWISRVRELFDIFYFVYVIKLRRLPLYRLWSSSKINVG